MKLEKLVLFAFLISSPALSQESPPKLDILWAIDESPSPGMLCAHIVNGKPVYEIPNIAAMFDREALTMLGTMLGKEEPGGANPPYAYCAIVRSSDKNRLLNMLPTRTLEEAAAFQIEAQKSVDLFDEDQAQRIRGYLEENGPQTKE